MKKAYLIMIAATSILMGCSKISQSAPDPNAWMYDESLPVPIMMNSVTEAMTKASVDNLDNITIGVFGLDGREGQPDWKWSGGIEYPQHQGILLNNQEASIVSGAIQFTEGAKYYPIAGSNAYNFYAYHPKQTVSYIDNVVTASYNYIGDTDILWADATRNPGYNSAYIRGQLELKKQGVLSEDEYKAANPNFEFKHKLTYLKFKLQATEENALNLHNAGVKVTGMKITNTYNSVKLIIADRNNPVNNGTVVPNSNTYTPISLKAGGNATFDLDINNGSTDENGNKVLEFGDGLLLLPEPDDKQFIGELTLTRGDGITETIPLIFKDPKFESEGRNFIAGHKYTFSIVLKQLATLEAYATLIGWTTDDDEVIEVDQFDNQQ
ncbi:MAG: fimbrillin family protein [Bacteroidales bacterium]|nr:fimbrillin family protein [Bacteroidales bacterium]